MIHCYTCQALYNILKIQRIRNRPLNLHAKVKTWTQMTLDEILRAIHQAIPKKESLLQTNLICSITCLYIDPFSLYIQANLTNMITQLPNNIFNSIIFYYLSALQLSMNT